MDYDTVPADEFGHSLRGLGLNLVVRDPQESARFLTSIFGMEVFRLSKDFAILRYGTDIFQIHADQTYAENPLLGLVPENPPRGAGVEIRLYDTDPDGAAQKATDYGAVILQAPSDKPHGLRECYILDADGYAWVPSRPLS